MSEDLNDYMDGRLKKEPGVSRQSRQTQDRRATQDREISEDERLEMFRMQLYNDSLPNIPDIPGYHVCWLTTTNPRDPIHRRIQLGYEPVKAEEVPGMAHASVKTGEYVGMIAVNEMLAFKLPESLYQRFMKEAHYDAPLREEDKLAEVADSIRAQAEKSGSQLIEGDGMDDFRQNAPRLSEFS